MTSPNEYDVLFSYSPRDVPWVEKLALALERAGVKVWFNKEDSHNEDLLAKKLEQGLQVSKIVISVWSLSFGLSSNLKQDKSNGIVVEINIPTNGINRKVSGLFAFDDETEAVFLLHRGRIGGGRKGRKMHIVNSDKDIQILKKAVASPNKALQRTSR